MQGLHHDAWNRSTSTFRPMSSRESSQPLPSRTRTRKPGAAGAASLAATETLSSTASARAGTRTEGIIARVNDLEHELRKVIVGDVRFDPASRLLYATDASMYQVEPLGVVIPRDADDVQAAVEVARAQRVALLPRGGGTSLTGQTVNRALVLDFSRHMHAVLEVNAEESWARVQPGLVQDNLNHHVRPLGLLFGPDTSTSNRATLGGMLGNNSGGSHSIAYGLTVEHVIELRTLLADGSRVVFGEITPDEFAGKCRAPGLEGRIYREIARIRETYGDEIQSRYPAHWRRVSGYNLNELVPFVAGSVRPGWTEGGLRQARPGSDTPGQPAQARPGSDTPGLPG